MRCSLRLRPPPSAGAASHERGKHRARPLRGARPCRRDQVGRGERACRHVTRRRAEHVWRSYAVTRRRLRAVPAPVIARGPASRAPGSGRSVERLHPEFR